MSIFILILVKFCFLSHYFYTINHTKDEKIMQQELNFFYKQIKEDIDNIKNEFKNLDKNLDKSEYTFNYWILSKIFNIDEELIPDLITEYSDKGIDCYVHFEESKELYIIQNKFYAIENSINRHDVTDFLQTPYTLLSNDGYKKSKELQDIYNKLKNDNAYKVFYYFFTTSNKVSADIKTLFTQRNKEFTNQKIEYYIEAKIIDLKELYNLYYGINYKQKIPFKFKLSTNNKGTFASTKGEYEMNLPFSAYYIITPIYELYKMTKEAEQKEYPIFDKNIREYLGKNAINNGIIETLKSKDGRKNFLYYNNGITIICDKITDEGHMSNTNTRGLSLINPQIINGCQTTNSIVKVLENLEQSEITEEYKNVYVMIKALIIDDKQNPKNETFYRNVVKYTNKQNAISEKAFASNNDFFERLKSEFETRGFLLIVKASDKNTFKTRWQENKGNYQQKMISKANNFAKTLNVSFSKMTDIEIELEKLLQIYLALVKNGYFAFTKKNQILQQDSEIYKNYSLTINTLTTETLIKLFLLYKRAENDKKMSEDKRTPAPYYFIGFLGEILRRELPKELSIQNKIQTVFKNQDNYDTIYNFIKSLTEVYQKDVLKKCDYNVMIKKPIDEEKFNSSYESAKLFIPQVIQRLTN